MNIFCILNGRESPENLESVIMQCLIVNSLDRCPLTVSVYWLLQDYLKEDLI